jgi:hypothetical protein
MSDNVPCALCDDRVYLDEPHVRLEAEYRGTDGYPVEYVAHTGCVAELDKPEP